MPARGRGRGINNCSGRRSQADAANTATTTSTTTATTAVMSSPPPPTTTTATVMPAGGAISTTSSTASNSTPAYEFKDYEDAPGFVNEMFGSLMQVAQSLPATQIQLVDNWWKIIQKWYPEMHSTVYTVPPVHFNSVSYKPRPEKPPAPDEPYARFGMYMYKPSLYSTVKDDEAQQRTLWTISSYLKKKQSIAFVLSNMEFQSYLNKDYAPVAGSNIPNYFKPNLKQGGQEGDFDVLVIHKEQGVFVFEVKAIGDSDAFRVIPETKKLEEISKKLERPVTPQMEKERSVLKKMLDVLDPGGKIKVRAGLVLANTSREHLSKAIGLLQHDKRQNLMKAMGLDPSDADVCDKICKITLCADDLPDSALEKNATIKPVVLDKVDQVWTSLLTVDGHSEPMDDDLYEHIVALFCGPLTTVKICTEKSMPRVRLDKRIVGQGKNAREKINVVHEEVRTAAGAARKVAIRFSELVLQQDQLDILQRNEDFVHLLGPPGTGKTLLLLLRVLTWLDAGHKVWIISFFPPSRSVTHVLFEQTKRMLDAFYPESEAEERKKQLDLFILSRPMETLDRKYYERRLHKFRDRAKHKDPYPDAGYPRRPTLPPKAMPEDRKVCLVVDESGMTGEGLHDFFDQVAICHKRKDFENAEFSKGLSVWSASVERCGRPRYAAKPGKQTADKFGTCWKLKMPLRCPPSVQRALMLVQPSLDARNICFFKRHFMMANPAFPMALAEVKKPAEEGPTGLYNQYPADGLPVFLIAHGSHEKAKEDIWYCKECGFELADYLTKVLKIGSPADQQAMSDVPLKCSDVMIVATQNSFQFSLPIAGFMYAMKKRKLKVAVNTTREEGKTAITDEDTILIVDMTSVHGLERAVIIVVPEVNKPRELPTMYKTFFITDKNSPMMEEQKAIAQRKKEERQAAASSMAVDEIHEDDPMKEVLEEAGGKNFSISAAGDFEKEDDSDEEGTPVNTTREETPMEVGGEGSQPEASQSSAPCPQQTSVGEGRQLEANQSCAPCLQQTSLGEGRQPEASQSGAPCPSQTTSAGEGRQPEASQSGAPCPQQTSGGSKVVDCDTSDEEEEGLDSLTYADTESERTIKAALGSLSEQSRKDIFYIGSRAVCQLILVHLGKKDDDETPAAEPSSTEPMETNEKSRSEGDQCK